MVRQRHSALRYKPKSHFIRIRWTIEMKLLQWVNWMSEHVDRGARVVVAVLVAAMSIILMAQVFFRFVLFHSLPWSEEASRYIFVWVAMLGGSIALRLQWHPGLTLLTDRLPARARAGVAVVANALILVLLYVVIREGFILGGMNASQRSPAMAIPMSYPYAAIWVGGIAMAVHVVRFLVLSVSDLFGRSIDPELDASAYHASGEEHTIS